MSNKNLERTINFTSRFGISDEDTLQRRLNLIPKESKRIFEARWGLDGKNYCPNYKLLDEKIKKKNSKDDYLKAEFELERSIYLLNILDYNEFEFDKAVGLGRLAGAIEGKTHIEDTKYIGKGIYDALESLTEIEKTAILKNFGLESGTACEIKEIAKMLSVKPTEIRYHIAQGLRKLRNPYIKKTFSTDIEEMENSRKETHISELEFSIRTYNCLVRAGIDTVEKLLKCSSEEIRGIRNMGRKSIEEINEKLKMLSKK